MSTIVYFLVWGTIIFLMMRFGCGAHVMGYGHRHGGTKTSAAPLIDGARWAAPDPATSKSAVHDGHVFYFCSQDCREKFEAAPALYTGIGKIEPQAMEQSDDHQH